MKLCVVLGLVLLGVAVGFGQAPLVEWEVQHGPGAIETGWSVIQTADGGFAVAGQTDVLDFASDYYLIRLAADGTTLWTQVYNSPDYEVCYGVIEKLGGGFFLAGTRTDFSGNSWWYVIETNASGTLLNSALSNTVDYASCHGATGTSDGGLVLCGSSYNSTLSLSVGLLAKLRADLTVEWSQVFDVGLQESFEDVVLTSGGGYAMTGFTWGTSESPNNKVLVVVADGTPTELWRQNYSFSEHDYGYGIDETSDGGFVVTGPTQNFFAPYAQAFLIRTTAGGTTMWTDFYGSFIAAGYEVIVSGDQGIVVTGYTLDPTNTHQELWIFKTDMLGQEYWELTFGDAGTDEGFSIQQTADGGYVVTGRRSSPFGENQNVYTIKLLPDQELEGPLAVELTAFDGVATPEGIRLSFATASEQDNERFEIYRAVENNFVKIADVESQGNSSSEQHYSFLDRSVFSGRTYRYYLADVSVSGARNEHREQTITVQYAADDAILPHSYALSAYPNPFNPTTTVQFSLREAGMAAVNVYDVTGRLVMPLVQEELVAGVHEVTLEAGSLPSGVYLIQLTTAAVQLAEKVVLMK